MLDPRQEDLHRAWCKQAVLCGGVPRRATFDPVDFPRCLPTLALYEFTENDSVRLRLVGTEIVKSWGADNTGRYLHEIMGGAYHDFIRGHIDQCRAERVPVFSHSRFQWDRGRTLDTRRLLLPYARNEKPQEVGFVLLSQVFDSNKVGPAYPLLRFGSDFEFFELERRLLPAEGLKAS